MKRPNIVFIIADQHRWNYMGCEDNGTTVTPQLDALAKRGTRFANAYCTSPLCCPSRAAIASGRYGVNSGCFTNLHELPPGTPSFVNQLRNSGYNTCATGKTHMEIHAYNSDLTSERHREYMESLGWNEICEISGNGMMGTGIRCAHSEFLRKEGMQTGVTGFYQNWQYFMDQRPGDPPYTCHEWPFEEKYQETAFVANRAIEWLNDSNGAEPFFLHVGFAAPHSPIEPFPRFMDLYRDAEETPVMEGHAESERVTLARKGYRGMISQIDHHIGRIVNTVERLFGLDNTIFVYTADHGDMAGDRGMFGKTCFYDPSVRVPLILAGPGIQPNRKSGALVELLDIGCTICDLCGVESHRLDQGKSLVPVLNGSNNAHKKTVYAEMGCDRMLFDGRHKLMFGEPSADDRKLGRLHLDKPVAIPPSPLRLFDLESDPAEKDNIAASEKDLLHQMMEKLLIRINLNAQTQAPKDRGSYKPQSFTGSARGFRGGL